MRRSLSQLTIVALFAGLVFGCASTRSSRKVELSGFLGDYRQLVPGPRGGAQMRYINPEFDVAAYPKLMLDPISVYTSKKGRLSLEKPEVLKAVVDYLDATVRKELQEGAFELVDRAGPDTLRMRIAITDAQASRPLRDLTSSVLPYGIALNVGVRVFTGKNRGVGEARLEMELLDSTTHERMAAAVDARSGTKNPTGLFDGWNDVKKAYDYWARKMADDFISARQERSDRSSPKDHISH